MGGDWERLKSVLGDTLVADLLAVSHLDLGQYACGKVTSPVVAARLQVVQRIVDDLAGGYNEDGVRRWFARPRKVLGGRSPVQVMSGGFDPGGDDVARVRQLAASLVGSGS
jgi:hypothetical protein